jgi:hypothetical protein
MKREKNIFLALAVILQKKKTILDFRFRAGHQALRPRIQNSGELKSPELKTVD